MSGRVASPKKAESARRDGLEARPSWQHAALVAQQPLETLLLGLAAEELALAHGVLQQAPTAQQLA